MENRDLKDVFRGVKEKRRKEKIERLLLYLSGLLLALIFIAIGLNFFSQQDKTISEPDVMVVKDINQPISNPSLPEEELPKPQDIPPQVKPPQTAQEVIVPKNTQTSQALPSKSVEPLQTNNQEMIAPKPEEKKALDTKTVQQNKTSEEKVSKPEEKKIRDIKSSQESRTTEVANTKQEEKKQIKQKTESDKVENNKPLVSQKGQIEEIPKQTEKDVIVSKLTSGYFSIQVGAFSTKEKALQEKSKYPNAFIIEEGGLHKVLVGKFSSDKEAREYKVKNDIDGFIKRLRD
ncbi:MAG: SPOR domain-containing protein [Hydrogenothermaceae bacterium]|nr:SPOR domain-containing protein [Hydrogenothermaceae bacterium]